jgi:hypothetical protein
MFLAFYFNWVWKAGFQVEDIRKKVRGLEALFPKPPRGTLNSKVNANGCHANGLAPPASKATVICSTFTEGVSVRLIREYPFVIRSLLRQMLLELPEPFNFEIIYTC